VANAISAFGGGILKGLLISLALLVMLWPADPVLASQEGGDNAPGDAIKSEPPPEDLFAEEAFFLLEEQIVTTATKKKELMGRAPAIMSVVTADEISHMGVTNYLDVLRRVPGVGISLINFGQWVIMIRGIRTTGTEKVKLLVDGHSVNEAFIGSGLTFFDDLPVENIQKIEIIRGPGSALYGANAFVGVINVITKKGADIDGIHASAGFGSFNTATVDLMAGKKFESGLEASLYFHYWKSDGMEEWIEQDRQSGYDARYGTSASLAPGRTTFEREKLLLNVNAAYEGLDFKGLFGWRRRQDYIGLSFALNEDSDLEEIQFFTELGYRLPILEKERLTSYSKVYFDLFDEDILWNQYPPGHMDSRDRDGDGIREVFPFGKKSDLDLSNLTLGFEEQLDLTLFKGNVLTFGFVYEHIRQFNVRNKTNQDRITGDALPELVDFTDIANWNKNTTRDIIALYLQDVWNVTDDIGLTLGVRYDRYSDFGDTVNPRAGLVWNFTKDGAIKLLYGRAFRAPNFRELYDRNSFSTRGNPDLDPEIINTVELEVSYKVTDFLKARVNYFYVDITDIIVEDQTQSPRPFINRGDAIVQGVETEVIAASKQGSYAYVNYSYWDPEDDDHRPLPDVPNHIANVGFNLFLWKMLNLNANLHYMGERERDSRDTRRDLEDFIRVDAAAGVKIGKHVDIVGSVYNIFDTDIREPSISLVPKDYPMPGRTFFFRVRYRF
jgi:iron complex outermembrane receptor protein